MSTVSTYAGGVEYVIDQATGRCVETFELVRRPAPDDDRELEGHTDDCPAHWGVACTCQKSAELPA